MANTTKKNRTVGLPLLHIMDDKTSIKKDERKAQKHEPNKQGTSLAKLRAD